MAQRKSTKSFIMLFKDEKYVDNMITLLDVYWSSCKINVATFQYSYGTMTDYRYTLVINLPFNIK